MKILEPTAVNSDRTTFVMLETKKEGQDICKVLKEGLAGKKFHKNTNAYKLALRIIDELPCY